MLHGIKKNKTAFILLLLYNIQIVPCYESAFMYIYLMNDQMNTNNLNDNWY